MNTRTLVISLAILATAAVAAPAISGAATPYKPCSGTFDPQGNPGGGFYRQIRAKAVPCTTARSVTKAWVVRHRSGSTSPTKKSVVLGYACTGTTSSAPDSDGLLKILCVRGGGKKAVRFVGSP